MVSCLLLTNKIWSTRTCNRFSYGICNRRELQHIFKIRDGHMRIAITWGWMAESPIIAHNSTAVIRALPVVPTRCDCLQLTTHQLEIIFQQLEKTIDLQTRLFPTFYQPLKFFPQVFSQVITWPVESAKSINTDVNLRSQSDWSWRWPGDDLHIQAEKPRR